MFIKRRNIPSVVKNRMKQTAGWRENNIMKNATHVYTSNKGRCIHFMNSRTGSNCQFELKRGQWKIKWNR